MEYYYPAVFSVNEDGSYTITFPDLHGCISEGKSLPNAMHMASDALTQWLSYLAEKGRPIPKPTAPQKIKFSEGEFVTLVRVDMPEK